MIKFCLLKTTQAAFAVTSNTKGLHTTNDADTGCKRFVLGCRCNQALRCLHAQLNLQFAFLCHRTTCPVSFIGSSRSRLSCIPFNGSNQLEGHVTGSLLRAEWAKAAR